MTVRFSRRSLFVRSSTSRPIPAFDSSPANSPPSPMIPERYASVMTTETEQFGTSPKSASSSSPMTGVANTVAPSRSIPTSSNIILSAKVTAISITAIFTVCLSAESHTLPSSSSHSQCSRSQKLWMFLSRAKSRLPKASTR